MNVERSGDAAATNVATLGDATGHLTCVPAPDWVEFGAYPPEAPEPDHAYVDNGLHRLLSESTVTLRGAGSAVHLHTVQRVLTRVGAEKASNFAVEFDPSHERIEVHSIRVLRAAERFEHARAERFQYLRRETKLERHALNGRITATLLVPDVRVGDLLELSLTQYSNNPVLEGKYAAWMAFNWFAPWQSSRHRLLRPLERSVHRREYNRIPSPIVEVREGVERSTWTLAEPRRQAAEEFTPPWLIQVPSIQFSEFSQWSDIARLFAPLYVSSEIPATLAAALDQIAATHPEPADRAAEWLRFVQRELRYFALSLGEGGLVPRSLEHIWSNRFGDCKDATRLYVAGARRLGLDACAALTSTTHAPGLCDFIPSPTVFNHCIVRLRLNGTTYWLDPTFQPQQGRLEKIFQPHIGWALPLTEESTQLEAMPEGDPVHYGHCEIDVHFGPKPGSPATLRQEIHYFSSAADTLRHRIDDEGATKLAEQMLKELRVTWPDLTETAPLRLVDDPADNHLTTIYQYEIRNCWSPPDAKGRSGFRITEGALARELNPLKSTERNQPLYLGRPRKLTWLARLHMPCLWSGNGWSRVLRERGLTFINLLTIEDRSVRVSRELMISAMAIGAEHAPPYNEFVGKLREGTITLYSGTSFGKIRPRVGTFLRTHRLGWRFALFLLWSAYVVWLMLH